MQSDEMLATREVEQGHGSFLWVVNRRCLTELECRLSPKETLKWLCQEAIFGQEWTLSFTLTLSNQVARQNEWG
jgi:hypothetical protein